MQPAEALLRSMPLYRLSITDRPSNDLTRVIGTRMRRLGMVSPEPSRSIANSDLAIEHPQTTRPAVRVL